MFFKQAPTEPGERVSANIAVLRQQHEENRQRDVGLLNMPKHRHALDDLASLGSAGVPALIAALGEPRPSADTPDGWIEVGVANDVAEVLGRIGDVRAIEPLIAQFPNHIVTAQLALANFPEGVEALLRGLDDPDAFIRGCCAQGLDLAKAAQTRAAAGIAKALEDSDDQNRWTAALAAWHLGLAGPDLLDALRRVRVEDPSERVRDKATDALGVLLRT